MKTKTDNYKQLKYFGHIVCISNKKV